MYSERRNYSGCAPMVITVTVAAFLITAVWWIESRFGSTTAILVIGGLFGVICLVVGYILSMANTKYTLSAATDFNRELAQAERYRQMTAREHARGEREAFNARAKMEVLDAKRVDGLAQQRANLLMDLERQRHEGPARQAPQWAVDDNDNGQFQTWE